MELMLGLLTTITIKKIQTITMPEATPNNAAKLRERKPDIEAAKKNNETVVIAEKSYITSRRIPAVSLADTIENPGVARANAAVSIDKPEGDLEWARKCDGYVCFSVCACPRTLHDLDILILTKNCRRRFSSMSFSGIAIMTG
jgi:hypothetical protein